MEMNRKIILGAITGLLALASFASNATPLQAASNDVVAREASEAPRGADNNNHRKHRGGRVSENAGEFILVRRGADDPPGTERPGDNHRQRRGGRLMEDADSFILAREASEGPRGADNDNHRRRGRGGRG
jgi:hypothetical protein